MTLLHASTHTHTHTHTFALSCTCLVTCDAFNIHTSCNMAVRRTGRFESDPVCKGSAIETFIVMFQDTWVKVYPFLMSRCFNLLWRGTLKFLPVNMPWRRRRGYRWLYPALTSALDEGGWSALRSVDLVRVVFYAHESARAFAETSRLSHGFLEASKKTSRFISSRLHAVVVGLRVIYLPEHCLYRTNAEAISEQF